ncbi:MAG: diguanylate cyclase [Gammaproteobacteria bacterium]|nr:diguanylate cyclase [Gammaproteobacteria bacterium]
MNSLRKNLNIVFPSMRISLALVLLTSCVLLGAEILGFTPQQDKMKLESRAKISESLALQMSILIPDQDIRKIQQLVRYIVKRNPEILSAGIRRGGGQLIFNSPNHETLWGDFDQDVSTTTHVLVPVLQDKKLWGNVELRFEQLEGETLLGTLQRPIFELILFFMVVGFFVFMIFMMRTLRQLDPSSVIPERVNAAFDTLAEGVMIIDENEQILLANKAFSNKIGYAGISLLGVKISELNWKHISAEKSGEEMPWEQVITSGKNVIGSQMIFTKSKNESLKFAINASPIFSEDNKLHGVLVTLDDISELEKRNTDLKTMISRLQKTQFQVRQKNKELSFLATRDALTGCLNRRSFSEQFALLFQQAMEERLELACIMVDLDHFKAVNDNYGHATGDEVIKMLAEILKSSTRNDDLVGRYGGEEFCLVLPGMSEKIAMNVAERIRLRVKTESEKQFNNGPRVTASFGVATILDEPESPEDLNSKADEALYLAKESGRNQVKRWQADSHLSAADLPKREIDGEEPEQGDQIMEITQLKDRVQELEEIATEYSAQLEYHQSYDMLTGLPNQVLFYDRIQQAIERGFRHDQQVAVLVIDIDDFSQINTSLGRKVGDEVLQAFAEDLNQIFRKTDGITRLAVSRFTADEFAVLLTDIAHQDQITWVIKRLLDSTQHPYEAEGHSIHLSTKTGISIYPADASNVDELLNHAITAKNFCKAKKGVSDYHFFDPEIQQQSLKYLKLEKELHKAIEHKQWVLLYQPKMDLHTGNIKGAEALLRWQHPERGLLTPYEFIEFAEKRKLIIPIGDWVLSDACRQIREMMDLGIKDCQICINLSSVQLIESDIVNKIFNALDEFNVPPRLLEVEVTETALIENLDLAAESLKRLSVRGIKISIDDFGTGYSSLGYLKSFPIDRLKIDRSFIQDINRDKNDEQIVKTIITMAHSLDLTVVAEGVEEEEQLQMLSDFGCDEIQGYLLSKPIPANVLQEIMSNPQSNLEKAAEAHPLKSVQ